MSDAELFQLKIHIFSHVPRVGGKFCVEDVVENIFVANRTHHDFVDILLKIFEGFESKNFDSLGFIFLNFF